MSIEKAVSESSASIQKIAEKLEMDIEEAFSSIRQNPRIKVLSESPRCFVIRASDLGNNWTPQFHDFEHQKEMLIRFLKGDSSKKFVERLLGIVEKGVTSFKSKRIYFHPDVRDALRKML